MAKKGGMEADAQTFLVFHVPRWYQNPTAMASKTMETNIPIHTPSTPYPSGRARMYDRGSLSGQLERNAVIMGGLVSPAPFMALTRGNIGPLNRNPSAISFKNGSPAATTAGSRSNARIICRDQT